MVERHAGVEKIYLAPPAALTGLDAGNADRLDAIGHIVRLIGETDCAKGFGGVLRHHIAKPVHIFRRVFALLPADEDAGKRERHWRTAIA